MTLVKVLLDDFLIYGPGFQGSGPSSKRNNASKCTLSACTDPGKDLVYSGLACPWTLQGSTSGYWLLERAQSWVKPEGGRIWLSVDKSQQWNTSRKVAGSILSAGKVFHRGIFVEDHSRLNSALSNGELYVSGIIHYNDSCCTCERCARVLHK